MNEASGNAAEPQSERLRQLLHAPPEFLDLLPVAAYACDAAGRILWFNTLAAKLWGRTPRIGDLSERFCGSYRLYFDGEETRRDQTPMAHALRSCQPVQGAQGVVERPDGSRVWAMVHILPVRDDTGQLIGAINCFHDTTELQRMTAELRDRQQELADFFENGAIAMHTLSGDGSIIRANRAELALLGYQSDEYVGRHASEFHADQKAFDDIAARLARGEKLERHPARLRARDGSIRQVLITSTPRFHHGRRVNTPCFTQDVTAEMQAKDRVADSEEHFRQLLESLPAAIYTTDAEGRITYYNKVAVELSGREPEIGTDKWCVTWKLYQPNGETASAR